MLLERCIYTDDLPVNIEIFQLTADDSVHYHLDTEILYVLKGTVRLRNGYCHYDLREGDIFTNSGHEVHQIIKAGDGAIMARIHISTHYFSQFFPDLSKACYRTYTRKDQGHDRRYERLRELLFQLLLKHAVQSSNYKGECIHLTADIIKVLDQHFNLFSMDKDVIVGIEKADRITIARISRICQYIYQHYAENITLEDLSLLEHLNSFYLSHLIKQFTGMSFRDLLCLARVEMSEILLLDTDDSVSCIAKAVGFSTTAYYEKYFHRWFHTTPTEHRQTVASKLRNDLDPVVQQTVSLEEQTSLIRQLYAAHRVRVCEDALIPSIMLNVNADLQASAIAHFSGKFDLVVTVEDYRALGLSLLPLLQGLHPEAVIVPEVENDGGDFRKLVRLLRSEGLSVYHRSYQPETSDGFPGNDTVLLPIHLLRERLSLGVPIQALRLRDADGDGRILQGGSGLVTAQGIRKPAYFVMQMLCNTKGDIICQGSQYCVLREEKPEGEVSLRIFVYNGSEHLRDVLLQETDPAEVRSALNEFIDEVTVDISLKVPAGFYAVEKLDMPKHQNIFAHISGMDFQENRPEALPLSTDFYAGAPQLETYIDDVRTLLNISFATRGAGLQAAVIHRIPQQKKEVCL